MNPKFNTLKVEQPLTSLIRDKYFSLDMLSVANKNKKVTEMSKVISVPSSDLVIQRSMHLCQVKDFDNFEESFKARYNAIDM